MARPFPFLLYAGLTGKSERRHVDRLERQLSAGTLTQQEHDQKLAQNLPRRPRGELLWLHAATPFALRSAIELFCKIGADRPELASVITLGTDVERPSDTAFDGAYFSALPEDDTPVVRRFLSHWSPDSLIWIGGRFRPGLLRLTREMGIPTLSIDAPKSPPNLDISKAIPGLRKAVMGCFDHVITATSDATAHWRRAGINPEQIEALGYLEEGGIAPAIDETELNRRMCEIGTRPSWFAAKIERSEVSEIIRAHKRALRRAHRLLLVMSLSDPAEADSVLAQFETAGMNALVLDHETAISEAIQVAIVPTERKDRESDGFWHRLSPVSFLGCSLAPFGGIDPYPAAAMGSAIMHGRHVSDFATAYARLASGKATRVVADGYELGEEVGHLMSPDQAALMASAAWEVVSTGAEVTDRVSNLVQDFLDLKERLNR